MAQPLKSSVEIAIIAVDLVHVLAVGVRKLLLLTLELDPFGSLNEPDEPREDGRQELEEPGHITPPVSSWK
jgi:hypothetical protein